MAMASQPTTDPDPALQAKAEEKREFVQGSIRRIERAMSDNTEQDRQWLKSIVDPKDPCFSTLIKILIEPKYRGFVCLHCVVLRALQLILRLGSMMVNEGASRGKTSAAGGVDQNVGAQCLLELAGHQLANEAFRELCRIVGRSQESRDPNLDCNALILLAELGPDAAEKALGPHLVLKLLDLFVSLPDRAEDLVEVALRIHTWGGVPRSALLYEVVKHPGGPLLCEVLLVMINRAVDKQRRVRAVKVLAGCLTMPTSEKLLYTNDVRVLVEILLRELPVHADDSAAFACHAECLKVLAEKCEAARSHRRVEVVQVLEDLSEDERCDQAVRNKCAEVLVALTRAGA